MKLIFTVIVTVTPIAVGPWGQANFDGQDPDTGKQPNIVFARILNLYQILTHLLRNENGVHWLCPSCSTKSIR